MLFLFDLFVMVIYLCLVLGGILNFVDKNMINKFKLLNEMLIVILINIWVLILLFMEMCLLLLMFNEE